MRTLGTGLTAAQKAGVIAANYKVVCSSITYEENRILHMEHFEGVDSFHATIVLDNADKAVTTAFKGKQADIYYGIGGEYSQCAPLWVFEQQEDSRPGFLSVTLRCIGAIDRMKLDEASNDFKPEPANTTTVNEYVGQIVQGVGADYPIWVASSTYGTSQAVTPTTPNGYYYQCTVAGTAGTSEPTWPTVLGSTVASSAVTFRCDGRACAVYSHTPAYSMTIGTGTTAPWLGATPADGFRLYFRDSRWSAVNQLLGFSDGMMLPQAGSIKIFKPVVAGTAYNYSYELNTPGDYHTFYRKAYSQRLIAPNLVKVTSMPQDTTQNSAQVSNTADNALLDIRTFRRLYLASTAVASSVATSVLGQYELQTNKGSLQVPMNVGQEVYDYVSVTDPRGSNVTGNISSISRVCGRGRFDMFISLGNIVKSQPLPVLPPRLANTARGSFNDFYDWFEQEFVPTLSMTLDGARQDTEKLEDKLASITTPKAQASAVGLEFVIDGGGSVISTGQHGHLIVPFECTITKGELLANTAGSIVVDIWRDSYNNYPPTVADSICGTTKLTLSGTGAIKTADTALTDWLRSIAAGDVLAFNVDSAATLTRVSVVLTVQKTA